MSCIQNCAFAGGINEKPKTAAVYAVRPESVHQAHVVLVHEICKVHGHAPLIVIFSQFRLFRRPDRSPSVQYPGPPFRLVCYCVCSVPLSRFRRVGLRACIIECDTVKCLPSGTYKYRFARGINILYLHSLKRADVTPGGAIHHSSPQVAGTSTVICPRQDSAFER
ncbi:hypothetical protein EVAR_79513_1 [Eumeta japonica]|uniref:Uncharacterized protein n=1 Tax=Eumeta variegata TaxID=151549 RepID=A0A4C1UF49_EUMVA|nr:hypothetical protein EVAR_79513_1 [Eumeta japonica]